MRELVRLNALQYVMVYTLMHLFETSHNSRLYALFIESQLETLIFLDVCKIFLKRY
jgi:hypothetical protein